MMRKAILILLVTIAIAIQTVHAWEMNITIVFENKKTVNLTFGMEGNATDKFDRDRDVPLPPPPPNADFYAYFKCEDPLFNKLLKDIRNYRLWELVIKTNRSVELEWDRPPVPLYMNIEGRYIDMTTTSSLNLSPGNYDVIISGYKNETLISQTITPTIPTITTTPTTTTIKTTTTEKTPGFDISVQITALVITMLILYVLRKQ